MMTATDHKLVGETAKNAESDEKAVLDGTPPAGRWARLGDLLRKAAAFGRVELRGITPIPIQERTVDRTINIFTLWWSMNANILPIAFGMLAPVYGLDLRNSALVILFFTLLTTILPAFMCTLGPKTGMRQMVQARYSFGRYLVCIPVLLNLATVTGFCVVMAVIGGQCLSAVADGTLSVSVGIVITALLTLVISFCGFRVLHVYERYAWIPAIIAIIIAAGAGGNDLRNQATYDPPPASSVLSYGMIVASYMIPWACLSSDFTTYLKPETSSTKIFVYAYAGAALPPILFMTLGAAIGNAVPANPHWQAAYDQTLVGGVLAAMLAPVVGAGFARFLVVLLAFSLLGNLAASAYSITLNLQLLVAPWWRWWAGGSSSSSSAAAAARLPRSLFAVVFAAVVIPVGIRAAADFFVSLENFLALIGYWSSAFLAVVLAEHFVFRGADCVAGYDPDAWDDAARLPWGLAALGAAALSFALVVPSMAQVWWTGPIAKTTGDIGFELAFAVTGVLYVPLRWVEKRWAGR